MSHTVAAVCDRRRASDCPESDAGVPPVRTSGILPEFNRTQDNPFPQTFPPPPVSLPEARSGGICITLTQSVHSPTVSTSLWIESNGWAG
jgi:hypothetical protein